MGLRPGRCYRYSAKSRKKAGAKSHRKKAVRQRSYSRIAIKVPRKNYIGAAPALKIRQFNMGNPIPKYDLVADLTVKDSFDLRDNAIESARTSINRHLVKTLGKDGFFMKVRVYPSNLLRENKQAQGAGADRVSQGMSLSFGIPIARSARVRNGQTIFSVLCKKGQETIVKDSLLRAKARFPCDVKVVFHTNVKSIGTLPSKLIEEKVAEKKEEKTEEGTTTEAGATGTTTGKTPTTGTGKTPAAGTTTGKTTTTEKTDAKKEEKKK